MPLPLFFVAAMSTYPDMNFLRILNEVKMKWNGAVYKPDNEFVRETPLRLVPEHPRAMQRALLHAQ
ncbi:hypothetical protein [Komagataeibacter xylinus]|uniref:hypothetical protein n=1 Tax=Komagataeibacter xylinus TaxID=28448 RepID=UPI00280B0C78|nr:hypothetical protein [Komagataeibacter xylinus]